MNLQELKNAVDSALETAKECGVKPDEIEVSLQIDTYGKEDVACSVSVEAHYDNDAEVSGFVLLGLSGYEV